MTVKLKIFLIIVLLIYLFCICKSVKRKNMHISYLIFWSITGVLLIIAFISPNFVDNLSNLLGFELSTNMIYSIAIFLILYLIYGMMKLITKLDNENTILIQELSILKKEVEEIKNSKHIKKN